MNSEVLLAIIFKRVEERLKSLDSRRGPRGQRGPRGPGGDPGKSFEFSEHQETIKSLIGEATPKFEDYTPEQIEALRGHRGYPGKDGKSIKFEDHVEEFKSWAKEFRLKFEDLSAEQIESLRGAKGMRGDPGPAGKDFNFDEHEATMKKWAEDFAITFDDFTAEQIEKIRGPRGREGKPGRDFNFEDNKESITKVIEDLISNIQASLKLKFIDLTAEEIESIRGPRGREGKPGRDFKFEEHKEYFDSLKPKFSDFTPEEVGQLMLKFSSLTEEEKAELKLKFEDLSEEDLLKIKGQRGPRGQRGGPGPQGDGGPQGIQGLRGVPGAPGVRGFKGAPGPIGLKGEPGKDGEDAPYITDIRIDQFSKDQFDFIFDFSDGTSLRSETVKLPKGSVFSGGGGGGGTGGDAGIFQGFSARFNENFDTVGARATLLQILDFSYVAPLVSLSSPVSSALREKGTTVPSVELNAVTTKRSEAILEVTFYKNGGLIHTESSPNPDGATETYTDASGFSDTTSYFARVSDGTNTEQSNTLSFQEVYPYYYGVGAPALPAADVANLTKDIVSNSATLARVFSPTAEVYYFAYPAAYPALTSILDTNGFETIGDWEIRTENITGLDGNAVSYRIYEFKNLTTQVGFTNTFKQ